MLSRSRWLSTILTSGVDFVAHLNLLSVEAASSQDAAKIRGDARAFVKTTDIEPQTLNTSTCIDVLRLSDDLRIPADEKVVQLASLWLSDNLSDFKPEEWVALASVTTRSGKMFWDATVFVPNETKIRQMLGELPIADALSVAKVLRSSVDENHFTLQCIFDRCSEVRDGSALTELLEIFAPIMTFRPQLVRLVADAIGRSKPTTFLSLAQAVVVSGINHPSVLSNIKAKIHAHVRSLPREECAVLIGTLGVNGCQADEEIVAIARMLIAASKSVSEYLALAEAVASFPCSDASDALMKAITSRIDVLLPDSAAERCCLAKCAAICGALETLKDTADALLKNCDVPPRSMRTLLEACIISDWFPSPKHLSVMVRFVHRHRDELTLQDLGPCVFGFGVAGVPMTEELHAILNTISVRARLSRLHDPSLNPQTVALLLRGCHLLGLEEESQMKMMENFANKAVEFRAAYSVADSCQLLLVARSLGEVGVPLTRALGGQLRSTIPVVEPAMLNVVARTFSLCRLRDVGTFSSIAQRAEQCADVLTENQILDILDAFEAVDMDMALGVETVKKFVDVAHRYVPRSPELEGELILWALKFGVDSTFSAPCGVPTTVKGQIDRLATFPDEVCVSQFVVSTSDMTAEEIRSVSKTRRMITAAVRVAAASFPDDVSKVAIHRLCMALAGCPSVELEKFLDEMVRVLAQLSARRLHIGSTFRIFGSRLSANAAQLNTIQVIDVLEAYAVMRVADDAVIRAILQRLNDLESSTKDTVVQRRAEAARLAFGHWGRRK